MSLLHLFGIYKQDKQVKEREVVASVAYTLYTDSDTVHIDVLMDDYDARASNAVCELLDVLSVDAAYIETVNTIKNALVAAGQEAIFLDIMTKHLGHVTKVKECRTSPCIKPSDMI